jgi:hypothetical protein
MTTPDTIPDAITQWCNDNNYIDPHLVEGRWWAFADGAVMAVPLPDELNSEWMYEQARAVTINVDHAHGLSSSTVRWVPRQFFGQTCLDIMARPVPPALEALARFSSAYGIELDPGMLRASADYINERISSDDLSQLVEADPLAIAKLSANTGRAPREILDEPPTINDVLELIE